jgi:tetratricopeptide (TPR) repeat protein
MTDQWNDRLSEYIDDELTPAERGALDAHLASCAECAATLEELCSIVAQAASLPPRPPAADLWPGIEPRLERAAAVMPFRPRNPTRRLSFTIPQLIAAGLALMVMSGSGVWILQHGGRATALPQVSASDALVVPASLTDPRYDEAIADLEQALNAGRADLDPETIRILEANLDAIDKAIDQSRRALAADPANMYLNNHLVDTRQRKLALLRRAAAMVGAKG